MAMLKAYFDASQNNQAEMFAIGGYAAGLAEWNAVECAWDSEKKSGGWNLRKGRFHAADIFRDIGVERGALCVRAFAQLLRSCQGIYSAVVIDDWRTLAKPSAFTTRYPKPYHFCFDHVLWLLGAHARQRAPLEPVAAIFDQDLAGADRVAADAIFDAYLNNPRLPKLTQTLTWGDTKSVPLLETADLFAGVAQRYWIEAEYPRSPNAAQAYGAREMTIATQGGVIGGMFDAAALAIAVEDFEKTGEPFGPP